MEYKKWDTRYMNGLGDSAFAVVNGSGRHLPHHNESVKSGSENNSVDLPHLRNALARVNQIEGTAQEKSRAKAHLQRHAKSLLPSYSKNVYNDLGNLISNGNMFRYFSKETDAKMESPYKFKGNVIEGVEVFRTGVFRGNLFNESYVADVADNFHELRGSDVFRDVPIRVDHPDMFGLKNRMDSVCGYVVDLYTKDTGETIEVSYKGFDSEGNEVDKKEKIKDMRLVADMEITEPDAFEKIKRTTFRNRSVELGAYSDNDGNEYEPVFMGVAWVDIPQVDHLNSLFSKDMIVEELNREEVESIENTETVEETTTQTEDVKTDDETVETKETVETVETDKAEVVENVENVEDVKSTEVVEEVVNETETELSDEEKAEVAHVVEMSRKDETISMAKAEVENMRNELSMFRRNERAKELEVFAKELRSVPAMFDLESQLVNSFFAKVGDADFLSADQQFALFKEIKSATPVLLEKKDALIAVDDKEAKDKLKSDYTHVNEDRSEYAKELVSKLTL